MRTLIVRIFDTADAGGHPEGLRGVVEQVRGPHPERRLFDGAPALLASIRELLAGAVPGEAAERSAADDLRG
ncbi:MAG TPA: hypothetical protein VGA36_01585 [Nitriliruptorales bacterium]